MNTCGAFTGPAGYMMNGAFAVHLLTGEIIMTRYPNNITFAWLRSDGDYEIVATLNGETIDSDTLWNSLVEQTLATLKLADSDTEAFNREDVFSVLVPEEDEIWTALAIAE